MSRSSLSDGKNEPSFLILWKGYSARRYVIRRARPSVLFQKFIRCFERHSGRAGGCPREPESRKSNASGYPLQPEADPRQPIGGLASEALWRIRGYDDKEADEFSTNLNSRTVVAGII